MRSEPAPGKNEQARVFFALWPDTATSAALHCLAEEAKTRFGGRAMRRDTLHLTLAFIGGVPRSRIGELIDAGGSVAPAAFDLALDQLGAWKRNHIVWAGPTITPEPLDMIVGSLHERLDAAGIALQQYPFMPHVTLLRNASCKTLRMELDHPVNWRVGGFQLVESKLLSTGAHYETLAQWIVKNWQ